MIEYSHRDHLTLNEAINFLAEYDVRPPESLRKTRDRTRQLIKQHRKKDLRSFLGKNKILFGQLISWAIGQKSFKGKLDGFPASINLEAKCSINNAAKAELSHNNLPNNLIDALILVSNLENEIMLLKNEVDELKPRALKYDAMCAQLKINGSKRKNV